MKAKEYEILTLLDFTKIPNTKLKTCLDEFSEWVKIMKRAQKTSKVLTPIEKFIWIDDKQRNITLTIVLPKKQEVL